jgi:benzylsuccinate CoA-transferase BbsF subunit
MGPFEGIRVLELGLYYATPWCNRIMASLGAEVIRLESSTAFDMSRAMGVDVGSQYADYGALKKMATLNMRHPKSREIARELVKKSDIFTTNLGKEVITQFGLDYTQIREIKPDIIMMWQSGFGLEGPYASYKAFGGMLQAITGLCEVSGFPEAAPGTAGTAFCDYHSSMYAVMLLAAALEHRRQTGEGMFIEVPLYETGALCIAPSLMDYMVNGRVLSRQGNRHPFASPHGIYRCQGEDRWCAIAVFTEEQWKGFCQALGHPGWTGEARFASLPSRRTNADEMDRLIDEWTSARTAEEVMARMQQAGVPASIVAKGQDLSEDIHLKERDFYKETEYHTFPFTKDAAVKGTTVAMAVPMRFSETPCQFGPTHRVGEDNDYVYGVVLGMSREEMDRLTEEGVLV